MCVCVCVCVLCVCVCVCVCSFTIANHASFLSAHKHPHTHTCTHTHTHTTQEGNRLQAAQCTGVLSCHLSDDQLTSVLRDTLLRADGESDWSLLQARATSLTAVVEAAAARIEGVGLEREVVEAAVKFATSDRVSVYYNTVY